MSPILRAPQIVLWLMSALLFAAPQSDTAKYAGKRAAQPRRGPHARRPNGRSPAPSAAPPAMLTRAPPLCRPPRPTRYARIVVDLPVAFGERSRVDNAAALRKSLDMCGEELIVCLQPAPSAGTRGYVLELYDFLWDAMLESSKIGLEVSVLTGDGLARTVQDRGDALLTARAASDDVRRALESAREGGRTLEVVRLERGTVLDPRWTYHFADDLNAPLPLHRRVAVGGTFDRLHLGHRKLLTVAALSCSETLTVGVTEDACLREKQDAQHIESFAVRSGRVQRFLAAVKPSLRVNIWPLKDADGPLVDGKNFDALVVSSEKRGAAESINEKRLAKGLNPLELIMLRRSRQHTLSSTYLRSRADVTTLGE